MNHKQATQAIKDQTTVTHDVRGGKYEIIGFVKGSKSKVEVKDIDRGRGWDEALKRYVGVKHEHGWERGQNYAFGQVETFSTKLLKKYQPLN